MYTWQLNYKSEFTYRTIIIIMLNVKNYTKILDILLLKISLFLNRNITYIMYIMVDIITNVSVVDCFITIYYF